MSCNCEFREFNNGCCNNDCRKTNRCSCDDDCRRKNRCRCNNDCRRDDRFNCNDDFRRDDGFRCDDGCKRDDRCGCGDDCRKDNRCRCDDDCRKDNRCRCDDKCKMDDKCRQRHNFTVSVVDCETKCGLPNACFKLVSSRGQVCTVKSDCNGCIKLCLNPCVRYRLTQICAPRCFCPNRQMFNICVNCCNDVFVNGVLTQELKIFNQKKNCCCRCC